jgi:beta-glucosidase
MIESLSLEELVAQMVVVRASGYLCDHQIRYPAWEPKARQLQHWLQNLGVGGVLLVGGSAAELTLRSQQLQSWAKYPLLLAADIEEGVGQRFAGATWFPPPMAIGAIAKKNPTKALNYAQEMGACTAKEALAIGLNWILAPVVDVNNNPDNPVINVRSFGDNPNLVGQLASGFIDGAHKYPVLTTAKHFPGHGDTAVDSHIELPVLPHSAERLEEIELPPFRDAIASGVDAVMTAHLLISAWDDNNPATLSHRILTGKLREELGFEGLIVTDALVMGAIQNQYGADEAPVLAVEAGADIILMPVDPEVAIISVCNAVKEGRISLERIQESVKRIWDAKAKVGLSLQKNLESNLETQTTSALCLRAPLFDLPYGETTSEDILRDSQRMGGFVPWKYNKTSGVKYLRNVILIDDAIGREFLIHQAPAIQFPEKLGFQLQIIDRHTRLIPDMTEHTEDLYPTLLQVFIRGNPFRGNADIIQAAQDWLKKLLRTGELQATVIYGSPYLLDSFVPLFPQGFPYVFSYGQMPRAQALALKTLFNLSP